MLSKRDANSVNKVKDLVSIDPTFKTLLEFTIFIADEQKFKHLAKIMQELLLNLT